MVPDPSEVPQGRKRGRGCQQSPALPFAGIVADDRLRITPTVAIDASDLTYRVSRSGGPGGQHANTSDTRVEISLDVRHCSGLSPHQRSLVMSRLGPVVRAVSADTRSQAKNRDIART